MKSDGSDSESAPGRLVSYAQNAEDIVLARGLLTGQPGFYVDIGGYDPDQESVTKLFYERGWRGINVEPISDFVDRFQVERPRDINICAAVSEIDGQTELWISPTVVPGHSTLDSGIAASHADDGLAFVRRSVASLRLATLLDKYLPVGQVVDFLKIDVEGAEEEVLRTWDPLRCRPRVIVVEAFAPHVVGSTHCHWESIVLEAGYVLALFDGLNRFYVRNEEPELATALSAPASVLDDYELVGYRHLRLHIGRLEAELASLKNWAASQRTRATWLEARLAATVQDR
jgi:FkbM family methyltransferase